MSNETEFKNYGSPETVAFSLFYLIAKSEGIVFEKGKPGVLANRKWILSSYAEALAVVRGSGSTPKTLTAAAESNPEPTTSANYSSDSQRQARKY
ncbi:hypothetical protein IYY11_04995 [Methylocystis sp. H62]|uniref:hypothetical protein n=1 Tax=Methylocystis sp. H62 TaxID=2785789 RepID=UPI0018C25B35|nr:hypothetical protein [Methylocystis sp. H62]MBG0792768.1 hypothetical protein [Methylocystis sp. H62]